MNAMSVFDDRKEDFLAQIEAAQGAQARIDAAVLAMEQIACVLAQEETDAAARQRQQAVLTLAKKAPTLLHAARAEGELVIGAPQKAQNGRGKPTAKAAGAAILALLAAYEMIDGQVIFAALQLAGCALLILGSGTPGTLAARAGQAQARGVLAIDAKELLGRIEALCRAADVCVSDLDILAREAGLGRISGTADEATLDLLCAMLEAKASGRSDAASRTLDQAELYLHRLGIEYLPYSAEHAAYFDVLPTLAGERTIRPALLQDGRLLRRGVAARPMERSVGA